VGVKLLRGDQLHVEDEVSLVDCFEVILGHLGAICRQPKNCWNCVSMTMSARTIYGPLYLMMAFGPEERRGEAEMLKLK
jgi:hypothetical protein